MADEYKAYVTTTNIVNHGGTVQPASSSTSDSVVSLLTSSRTKRDPSTKNPFFVVNGHKWRYPAPWNASSKKTSRLDGIQSKTITPSAQIGPVTTTIIGPYTGTATALSSLTLGDIWSNGTFSRIHPLTRARLETECMVKFDEGKFHMASATVELSGSLSMLAHRTSPIWKSVIAARQKRFAEIPHIMGFSKEARKEYLKDLKLFARNPRAWSDLFLEYKFGWDPLMSDIAGLYEYSTSSIRNDEYLIEAVRTLKTTSSSQSGNFIASASQRAQMKIFATVTSDALRKASEVGLLDPLGIAWEGYPMSFVVDWLFPVGNLLTAARARNGLTFKAGYINRKSEVKCEETYPPIDGYKVIEPQTVITSQDAFVRETIGNFPLPKPYLKSPFSTNTVVTGAALASQVYLRR